MENENGDSKDLDPSHDAERDASKNTQNGDPNGNTISSIQAELPGLISATGKGSASSSSANSPACNEASARPVETNERHGIEGPSKKMLKVRPDGKLSSPRSKGTTRRTRRKGAGKSSFNDSHGEKVLFVSIKYGRELAPSSDLGHKIDDILLGKVVKPESSSASAPKQHHSPIATHPFFLGPAVRSAGTRPATSDGDSRNTERDKPLEDEAISINPRKARIISKPPGTTQNATANDCVGRPTFGTDYARICRFPGAMEPLWPPKEMLGLGCELSERRDISSSTQLSPSLSTRRKMKSVEIKVPVVEMILTPFSDLVSACRRDKQMSQDIKSREVRSFRRPIRHLMRGRDLQKEIGSRLRTKLTSEVQCSPEYENTSAVDSSQPMKSSSNAHRALHLAHERIATSLSAFDRFTCEAQDWAHKYAPKSADEVLQSGREAVILRDWLRSLTVHSTEDKVGRDPDSSLARKMERKAYKRKRRKVEDLDDFVVSSDEEVNQLEKVSEPEEGATIDSLSKGSMIRSRQVNGGSSESDRCANAVVVSGPHGCGKTAAVYAVANELGFEVFEINAGSRRSGKDLHERVGDMTRNHLVRHDPEQQGDDKKAKGEESEAASAKMKLDIESGRQGTVNKFFKSQSAAGKKQAPRQNKGSKISPSKKLRPSKPSNQKQSLILLEEVDTLFEEDKAFWPTTLELILQSKRPLIMTCTDENLLPLEEMLLYAILRFTRASQNLATDYLSLVASNEGHLLPHEAISNLYASKGCDLRASLNDLNFFCQMAVGDTRGGLDWMHLRMTHDTSHIDGEAPVRVVSQDTYDTGMGWLSGDFRTPHAEPSFSEECNLLMEIWNGWDVDLGSTEAYLHVSSAEIRPAKPKRMLLELLQAYDTASDALSAADTWPSSISRQYHRPFIETGNPKLSEKSKAQYIEGLHLVQADIKLDPSGMSDPIAIGIRVCARRLMPNTEDEVARPELHSKILDLLPNSVQNRGSDISSMSRMASAAFDPIARPSTLVLGMPKGPQISALDGPISVVLEDIAPFLRNIVSYDLRLEEQRDHLSSLVLEPGLKSKKQRTTRASRAALEGGQKANTRRERWFPKKTDLKLILQSGGQSWQQALELLTGDYDK